MTSLKETTKLCSIFSLVEFPFWYCTVWENLISIWYSMNRFPVNLKQSWILQTKTLWFKKFY